MMRNKGILTLSVLLLLCLLNVRAIAGCNFSTDAGHTVNAVRNYTVPLAKQNISVPAGATINSVIYQQRIYLDSIPFLIECDSEKDFKRISGYDSTPYNETSSGSKTYKTNIEGIGIRFTSSTELPFPVTYNTSNCVASPTCDYEGWTASTYIQFIKISEEMTGGIITGADLPVAIYTAGQTGSMVDIYKINISGSLTVNAPTCDINPVSQSMVVPMGSHKVSDFSGKGSGTDWKDASIKLQNCGFFYGNSSSSIATFNGTGNINIVPLTQNMADITLAPVDGIENAADGIINIADKPLKATGIGIQLSRSENVSGKINLDNHYQYSLPNDGSRTITVPLFARYIQTGNTLSAGVANGKLIYTISYR